MVNYIQFFFIHVVEYYFKKRKKCTALFKPSKKLIYLTQFKLLINENYNNYLKLHMY